MAQVSTLAAAAGRVNAGRLPVAALAAAAIAAVANLLIWLLAGALGLPLAIQIGGPQSPVVPLTAGPVIVMSVVPALLAAVLLWLLGRFTARPFLIFQIIAGVVLVLSLAGPLGLQVGAANKIVLAVMHVVAAVVIVGMLRRMARQL